MIKDPCNPSMFNMRKFDRDIMNLMLQYGFSEVRRTGGHVVWKDKEGRMITTSCTPSRRYELVKTKNLLKNKYKLEPFRKG